MASPTIALFATSTTVAFYPEIPSGLNVMGQSSYLQSIQSWQADLPYWQKIVNTDKINILVHTQKEDLLDLYEYPKLYICNEYKEVIAAVNLQVDPYLKGNQAIAGNTFLNPYTLTTSDLVSTMWAFSFDDFVSDIPDMGTYYLRMDIYTRTDGLTTTLLSEPLLVALSHENTMLFQSTYNSNIWEKNVVITGWFDDYGSGGTTPYSPVFMQRCEGYIFPLDLKVLNIGYLQQSYLQNQQRTLQQRVWTLKLGEISTGIPYYMLEKVTEIVLADNLAINGYLYILFNPSSSTSLTDLWKTRSVGDGTPLIYAATPIAETTKTQQALLSPTDGVFGTRIFTGEFDDTFA